MQFHSRASSNVPVDKIYSIAAVMFLKSLSKFWAPLPKSKNFVGTESVLSSNFVPMLLIVLRSLHLCYIKKDSVVRNEL